MRTIVTTARADVEVRADREVSLAHRAVERRPQRRVGELLLARARVARAARRRAPGGCVPPRTPPAGAPRRRGSPRPPGRARPSTRMPFSCSVVESLALAAAPARARPRLPHERGATRPRDASAEPSSGTPRRARACAQGRLGLLDAQPEVGEVEDGDDVTRAEPREPRSTGSCSRRPATLVLSTT